MSLFYRNNNSAKTAATSFTELRRLHHKSVLELLGKKFGFGFVLGHIALMKNIQLYVSATLILTWCGKYTLRKPQKLNVTAGIMGDHIYLRYFPSFMKTLALFRYTRRTNLFSYHWHRRTGWKVEWKWTSSSALPHYVAPVRQFLDDDFRETGLDYWI